jgi:hypothetical protein
MEIRKRLATSGASGIHASLVTASAASAHAGEQHVTSSPDGSGGLGVLAVAVVAGFVYWLVNRGGRRSEGRCAAERATSGTDLVVAVEN